MLLGSIIGGVLAAVLGGFALAEAKGWLPHIQNRLLDKAVSRLPREAQGRYSEEWRALLADYSDRPITAFVQAASLYLKAGSLAAELSPAPRAVKSSGEGADLPRGTEKVKHASNALGRVLARLFAGRAGSQGGSRISRWLSGLSLASSPLRRVLASLRAVAGISEGTALIFLEVFEEATEKVVSPFVFRLLRTLLRLVLLLLIIVGLRAALGLPL